MSRRIQIVIPDQVAEHLNDLAHAAGEPPSTLAARLLRTQLADHDDHAPTTAPTRAATAPRAPERPRWLEPYGGDAEWRRETWGAIVSLHARYPDHLAALKDGWWTDEAQTEQLSALAAWRAEIDDHGHDPREELAFHAQLEHHRETLRRQPGGVQSTWTPGPPPRGWADA